MKAVGFFLLGLAILLGVLMAVAAVRADYEWKNEYASSWSLADKSSTLRDKASHIEAFVSRLEASGLTGSHDAAIFKTPDNSFDKNMDALRSLRSRLREMQEMDPTSFAYQTAMQQVTEQEQGEAGDMIGTIRGCWMKRTHPTLWGWWNILIVLGLLCAAFVGAVLLAAAYDLP